MSLEELWELFPIILSQHNPEWRLWAEEEIFSLTNLLVKYQPTINHIGSTAIPNIYAKPIVDILVEIPQIYDWMEIKHLLEDNNYLCMNISDVRMSFNKGYTLKGYAERVFHVHVRIPGDNDEIVFRDYLIKNPACAREYEQLKLSLLPKYKNQRDAYTESKTCFIKTILNRAGG